MTGPEHYMEAERLLDEGIKTVRDLGPDCGGTEILASAQVHATLALAAASALNDALNDQGDGGMPVADYHAWCDVASVPPRGTTS